MMEDDMFLARADYVSPNGGAVPCFSFVNRRKPNRNLHNKGTLRAKHDSTKRFQNREPEI